MKAHDFSGRIGWLQSPHVCIRCGLVRLNNAATRKAAAKPCPGKDDSDDRA